jgi:hypothetical protein
MKGIGRSLLGVVLLLSVGLTLVHGQRTSRDSAWEKVLQSDPAAADDPSIGWRERLILNVLNPEQADHYFRTGADPKSLLIDSGQTLQEYLDSRLNPPAAGYVALPVPCPVFASDRLEAGLRYGVRVRGGDLSLQGGSATGCGIPAEATAVILSVKLEDPIPGTRLKMWAADGPEPAEAVLDVAQGLDPAFQKTVVLTLAEPDRPEGDLLLQTVVPAAAKAEVVGYFRALRTDDAPGGGVSFYTEGAVNNFFGTDAGASITSGTSNSFFGTAAGTSNTTGSDNTFFGHQAGHSNTGGGSNSFFGRGSGYSNTLGIFNNFFGVGAGFTNTTGSWNSFFGPNAGYSNTEGYSNAFFGEGAGYSNTTGFNSNFFGTWAGYLNTEGQLNSFFGSYAGASNTVESHNTLVGAFSDLNPGSSPETSPVENATALGYRSYVSRSNSLVLGSIAGVNGATDSVDVGIGTPAPQARFHVENTLATDSDDFVVTSVGKVGVGTVAPANGVHVKGDAPGFIFEETDWGNQKWQMAALNGEWRIRDLSAGNVYPFRVAPGVGSNALVIAPSANVGIGTDTPSYKLHVIGSIFATGGIASSRDLKEDITPLDLSDALQIFDKDEGSVQSPGFFLMRGQSFFSQVWTASSSRSTARRWGFWGLQPSRCRSLLT